MKKILFVITLVLLAGFVTVASAQSVVGSKHDLSAGGTATPALRATNVNEVCVFCHTPHQVPAASGQDPLWNHTLSSTASYGVYASTTMDAILTSSDLGGATAGTAAVSNLCLSCHDGTVGLGSLYNSPAPVPDNNTQNMTGSALVGVDLTNDHPVNFLYDTALATLDGGLITPTDATTVDGTVPLFAGTVQCASCHDVHDSSVANAPFLVKSNAASALCTTCHTK